jgi:SWI/SNF-related matrix-associated actin-dependent regulator 1 of chromatin subfamily A
MSPGAEQHLIKPHPQRSDWYAIPPAWIASIGTAPSIQLDKRYGPLVHRSHLPILAKLYPAADVFLQGLRSQVGSNIDLSSDQIAKRAAFDATTEPNGWKLRDYQHAGREFITSRRGVLLSDSMRVGKSAQVVSSHDVNSGPLVVIAPLATREVWLSWFKRRWPGVRPTVLQGKQPVFVNPKKIKTIKKDRGFDVIEAESYTQEQLKAAKLVFANYDIIAGWQNFGNLRIGTLAFDECHILAHRRSRRSIAAQFLATSAERVIGATGTPVWNRPSGLFTMLSCINPGAWGTSFLYLSRYCDGHAGSHGFVADGTSNEEEFKDRLTEVMIRRTWEDISGQLPQIERTVEVVEISEKQSFEIEKEAERVRDHATKTTAIGALARFRRLLGHLKIDGATDAALRVLQSNERVIVWTWHRDVALKIEQNLAKANFPGFVVSGSTDMNIREEIFNRWRKHPCSPLVITLAVGQVGIDLSAARQEIFAELDFTPSVMAQAEMRPFTPTQPISATYIIIDHEVDRKILEALQTKCDLANRLGVPAAESTIDVIVSAFAQGGGAVGTKTTANVFDFSALAAAVLADHPIEDDTTDGHGTMWDYDWEVGDV